MAEARVERRLAAILAADVAGFSRLMGVDEEGTLASLKRHRRELIDPKIAEHRGRIVKTTGDGALVEFASVVDAVRCAVDIQQATAKHNANIPDDRRIEFRIGINVGDIIIDEGDIYGDGVNIAARIEALAQPGAICLSDNAYRQITGKLSLDVADIGEQQLKNIAQPVRVYTVRIDGAVSRTTLSLPDKPSLAVLPFQNMSGDPEQEYFADGMVEEIITALSRLRWLFVIARNSSFTYKGRSVDVKQVGRELGVRYVLEGSVRKAGSRVRITGQLIDATNGAHLWADRFDGALEDVFDLQDQITTSVVNAIAPKLQQAEIERARRKPTESLDAYDCYLRGIEKVHQRTQSANEEALRLLQRAIELDPEYASAYGMAAWCYVSRQSQGWMIDRVKEMAEAARLAQKAVELGKDDAVALSGAAQVLGYIMHDFKACALTNDRALHLNPNLASAWYVRGWLEIWLGKPDRAIEHFAQFERMSPVDPLTSSMHAATALAHVFAGRFENAAAIAEQALSEGPNLHQALRAAATSYALLGQIEQAQKALARLLQIDPTLRISKLKDLTPLQRPEDIARYVEGMRKAGLPD
jgi:TolB-like protein/class 3 adenylate cyclase